MRVAGVVWLLAVATIQVVGSPEPLTLVRSIELPHVEGRIDHLAFDSATQRLYVAALGNNTVEVLDVKAGLHLRSLAGFREPQGIAVAADGRSVGVANGQGEGLQLLSADDYRPGTMVRLGGDADNVRYDAAARRLYVGYGGGALAVIDPAAGTLLGQVKLAGHPESCELERGGSRGPDERGAAVERLELERDGSRVFVNIPNAEQIAVVDRASMTLRTTWPLTTARANYPMSLDEAHHRLFIGCRRPARALVLDTTSGKESASFEIVGDTDDLFYDGARQRVYVSGGDGFIDVVEDQGGNRFTRIGHVATAAGARTSLFVAEQGRLYLAVPHRGNQRAEVRVYDVH